MTGGTIMSTFFKESPIKAHREAYKESLVKRGGYFNTTTMPAHLMPRFFAGYGVGMVTSDSMAPYRHVFYPGKESMWGYYTGYYYGLRLPIQDEMNWCITALFEAGITEQVAMSFLV